jgi:DNA polymerase theta
MLSHSADVESIKANVDASLEDLQSMDFISLDGSSSFQATRLGQGIVASSLDPEDGVFIHNELKKALQAFVMDGEMHVLYTFTPVHDLETMSINWRVFWNEMERLDDSGLRAMRIIGLKPNVISTM